MTVSDDVSPLPKGGGAEPARPPSKSATAWISGDGVSSLSQWRIQKFWKGGRRQFISPVLIYRKCTQRSIGLLHGKKRLLEKNEPMGGAQPPPPPWIRHWSEDKPTLEEWFDVNLKSGARHRQVKRGHDIRMQNSDASQSLTASHHVGTTVRKVRVVCTQKT